MKKNIPVEIFAGLTGLLVAAAHVLLVVYVIMAIGEPDIWDVESMGILTLFLMPVQIVFIMLVAITGIIAIFAIVFAIVPMCLKNTTALRVVAIITSVLVAIELVILCLVTYDMIASAFQNGDYTTAMIPIGAIALAFIWFLLNVIKAIIYRRRKQ